MGTTRDFQSVAATSGDGSKNDDLSYSHAGFDASTLRRAGNGAQGEFDHAAARADDCCAHCGQPGATLQVALGDRPGTVPLHRECEAGWLSGDRGIPFMITNAMWVELSKRGYSAAEIFDMAPQQAHDILKRG